MDERQTHKGSVLVIDDDAVVGRSFDRVLSEIGYQVSTALDGASGLDLLETSAFDLVFTDIKMPGMDGLEVASRIAEQHPGLPVVIATGFGSEANENRAREIGVANFVRKPLSPDLIQMITAQALVSEQGDKVEASDAETALAPVEEEKVNVARNIALFFAAPFIGLAYIMALPFIGAWMLLSIISNRVRGTSEK